MLVRFSFHSIPYRTGTRRFHENQDGYEGQVLIMRNRGEQRFRTNDIGFSAEETAFSFWEGGETLCGSMNMNYLTY